MLDKNYLAEIAQTNFPDLANTNFQFNNIRVSSFTESILLPFLVYQNTVDTNNRLIGLFLPENSNIINLVPFYAIMAHYRKALNKIMQTKKYQNQTYGRNEKQVVFNSDICIITSVDFINRQLVLRTGGGREINLSFNQTNKISWQYDNAQDLCKRIDSFDTIDKANKHNIFTLPFLPSENQYEGVIIFTNTSKFESLLRNIKISKNDIRDHLNIEKVAFPASGGHNFIRLSSIHTKNKPVSVLVARLDAFRAYTNILESGGDKYKHIKTIVIDEFDELLMKWEREDKTREELSLLKDSYFLSLKQGSLKDIYLICKNSCLNIHEIFKKNDVDYNPWLVKPLEANTLNKETSITPEIFITNIGDLLFENLNYDINSLIYKWKELAKSNFCNGEILMPITNINDLRVKLNSFFNPIVLKNKLDTILYELDEFNKRYFLSGQDYGLIKETNKFIDIYRNIINFKLNSVFDILKNKTINGCIKIFSDNKNETDIGWMKNQIHSLFPDASIIHYNKKDSLKTLQGDLINSDIIFYLTADKYILGNALGNILAKDQVFILNNRSYSFGVSYSKRYQNLQIEAGSLKSQYHLLNIEEQIVSSVQENSGIIPLKLYEKEINHSAIQEVTEIPEPRLNDWVEEIILKHKNINLSISENYILFFEDGTFELLPENRKIYLYEDDGETDDIEKSLKPVCELEYGEQIILPKRGIPVKDLLEETLKKNEHFSLSIDMDSKWRILIYNHITRCRMDLNYFRKKLKDNGFNIGSDQTVQHWIDGDTRRPDNFQGLLNALALLGIINEHEINSFDRHNSELKSIQMKFVRTAISKLVSRLNGIDIEYDENFNDELLNNFIDHIEIKRISSLYKL
jgi:hypothetical protein